MKYSRYWLGFIVLQVWQTQLMRSCDFVNILFDDSEHHMSSLLYFDYCTYNFIFCIFKLQQEVIILMKRQQEQFNVEKEEEVKRQFSGDQEYQEEQEERSEWKKIQKPQKQVSLFMIDFNQCDSKKCTGRKMERFKLLKSLKDKKKKFKGVVLSAFGDRPVSKEDLPIIQKNGICVIDCSWNRLNQTQQFRFKHERILPYVVAGNPVNYGKPFQLSCAEALATALCCIDYVGQAQYIMSKFGWADGFWSINQKIKGYGECKTFEELQKLSEQNEEGQGMMQQRQYEMPQSSDSD